MNTVEHLVEIAKEIEAKSKDIGDLVHLPTLVRTLDAELDKLNPADFVQAVRKDFVQSRVELHGYLARPNPTWQRAGPLAKRLVNVLENYGGEGSGTSLRSFAFIKDPSLRTIIERDYRELRLKVYPAHAWKSTVILAGSILEAILFDQLTADPAVMAKAMASSKAPKDKHGTVWDISAGDWKLEKLISVAADIGVLPKDRADTFDQVLRDYRNFVHPKKEIRSQHSCGESEAMMAVGALDGVCNVLS